MSYAGNKRNETEGLYNVIKNDIQNIIDNTIEFLDDLMIKLNNVINLYEYILQNIDDFKKIYDNKNKKSLNNFIKVVLNQVINLTKQCVNQINNRITSEINADNIIVIQKCINCMDIMWKVHKHIKLL
jgi:hypothetical protein